MIIPWCDFCIFCSGKYSSSFLTKHFLFSGANIHQCPSKNFSCYCCPDCWIWPCLMQSLVICIISILVWILPNTPGVWKLLIKSLLDILVKYLFLLYFNTVINAVIWFISRVHVFSITKNFTQSYDHPILKELSCKMVLQTINPLIFCSYI